jgi:glutamate-1-semialdehyde 2,1-aminomutase
VDVFPNDFEGLKRAFEENKDKGGIAAVIVEPVGGESGTHPVHPEWNKTIRRLCDEYGALLIFDEVVTGFRLDLGGAQKYLNINADIVVFGKIIAHGYPAAGGIGGRKDIMNICSGVGSIGQKAYIGGTLSANPISTAACYHAIKLIEENNAIQKATEYADKLTKAMNDLFSTRKDLPFFAYNFGPIIHYETTGMLAVSVDHPDVLNEVMTRRHIAQDYQMVIIDQGIFTLAGSRMYTCMQHDKEALDKTIKAWEYTLSLIPKG